MKKTLLTISLLFTIFCLRSILFQPAKGFDSLQTSISAIILIAFCIAYLFEQINTPGVTVVYSDYKFWIVLGILFYLAGTFFLFILITTLPNAGQYWAINNISNILKNILFALAIFIYVKSLKGIKVKYPENHSHVLN